jgi:hypothetical protein
VSKSRVAGVESKVADIGISAEDAGRAVPINMYLSL